MNYMNNRSHRKLNVILLILLNFATSNCAGEQRILDHKSSQNNGTRQHQPGVIISSLQQTTHPTHTPNTNKVVIHSDRVYNDDSYNIYKTSSEKVDNQNQEVPNTGKEKEHTYLTKESNVNHTPEYPVDGSIHLMKEKHEEHVNKTNHSNASEQGNVNNDKDHTTQPEEQDQNGNQTVLHDEKTVGEKVIHSLNVKTTPVVSTLKLSHSSKVGEKVSDTNHGVKDAENVNVGKQRTVANVPPSTRTVKTETRSLVNSQLITGKTTKQNKKDNTSPKTATTPSTAIKKVNDSVVRTPSNIVTPTTVGNVELTTLENEVERKPTLSSSIVAIKTQTTRKSTESSKTKAVRAALNKKTAVTINANRESETIGEKVSEIKSTLGWKTHGLTSTASISPKAKSSALTTLLVTSESSRFSTQTSTQQRQNIDMAEDDIFLTSKRPSHFGDDKDKQTSCHSGYTGEAVVSGIIGGFVLGCGLMIVCFYGKTRCNKYVRGDYRRVPMEYDFELNPRYKTR